MRRWWPLVAWLLVIGTACGGGVIQSVGSLPPAPPGQGFLEVRCAAPGAAIFVDDVFQGEVARHRDGVLPLPVGRYRISIKADGHYSWYGDVQISAQPTLLEIALVKHVDVSGRTSR